MLSLKLGMHRIWWLCLHYGDLFHKLMKEGLPTKPSGMGVHHLRLLPQAIIARAHGSSGRYKTRAV